jgi:cytochrome b6-f complex iron-sulfur subunit
MTREKRVDRWTNDLLNDRSPRGLRGGEEDSDALAAAIDLRSASTEAGLPDPAFVETLRRRIAVETQGEIAPRQPGITRRGLLAAGGIAAAAAAAGAIGERVLAPPGGADRQQARLVPDSPTWVAVAAVAEVPPGSAKSFTTPSVDGFVVNRNGEFAAVSGVCTHLGCRLLLNREASRLDCACHRAAFAYDGAVLYQAFPQGIPPLPLISTRVRDGSIEVLV